jgi:hypothetical protein
VAEFWSEFGVCRFEIFREDARLGNGSHEVCVAGPSWQQVNVKVVHDARARSSAKVHTQVEA